MRAGTVLYVTVLGLCSAAVVAKAAREPDDVQRRAAFVGAAVSTAINAALAGYVVKLDRAARR